MTPRRLILATGNPAKAELLQESLAGLSCDAWEVVAVDPGDAERAAPVGYEQAAIAKATAVGLAGRWPAVVGHDSGFEFACLGGAPGPLTARWLREKPLKQRIAALQPCSVVHVVHSIALWTSAGCFVTSARDRRHVVATPPVDGSHLPLTDVIEGERMALATCLARLLDKLTKEPTSR